MPRILLEWESHQTYRAALEMDEARELFGTDDPAQIQHVLEQDPSELDQLEMDRAGGEGYRKVTHVDRAIVTGQEFYWLVEDQSSNLHTGPHASVQDAYDYWEEHGTKP